MTKKVAVKGAVAHVSVGSGGAAQAPESARRGASWLGRSAEDGSASSLKWSSGRATIEEGD
jgi:hypothetical protein